MQLQYKTAEVDSFTSISAKRVLEPYVGGNWHFHKEFELIYFLEGQGTRIVGDHISNFQRGELVLVGAWLPHLWRNDPANTSETDSDFVVIKFPINPEGVNLFSLSDLAQLSLLLKRSSQGILFPKTKLYRVHDLILQIEESKSIDRFVLFLRILQTLSEETEYRLLSSPGFSLPTEVSRENRLQKVIHYIACNYSRSISLEEIAEVAHMTPPAFCRYFKQNTNKTFSHFLNEFRISNACQLLINGDKSIKEICFDVGFNSLTNFNRTFRSFKDMTPSNYQFQRGRC